MRRVAIFAPHYAEYTTRLALEMSKTFKVLLILDATNRKNEIEAPLYDAAREALEIFEFRSDTRITRRISRLTVSARILLFRPDVVHVQEQPDQLTSFVIGAVKRFFPIVLTVHDPKPHTGRDAAYAQRWDKYRRRIRGAAQVYHVHGAFCHAQMELVRTALQPIVDTSHGIILTPAASQLRTPTPNRFLLFGRMEEYKGLGILLAAAKELSRRGLQFELCLAGRGPELDRMRGEIDGMPNVSVLNHYLTPSEAIAAFQQAAVTVVPYLEATQSGVVAASFGNGRAVIATSVGGLANVVQNEVNGLSISPGSVTELADAMERLIRTPELLKTITRGAQASAQNEMSWTTICGTLAQAYHTARAIWAKSKTGSSA